MGSATGQQALPDPAERARYQAVSCYFAGEYVAEAGLLPEDTAQTESPVSVAEQEAEPPGLGLGLGLGLGSEQIHKMDLQDNTPAPAEADPLGLGLGLGLGENAGKSTSEPAAPPQGETQRLLIKAEC